MKVSARVIALGFLGYAFMLAQANPAQGTLLFIRITWGDWAVWGFGVWFVGAAIWLSFFAWKRTLISMYIGILPQLAYAFIAVWYVILNLQNSAQWGIATTHGFGALMLMLIIWILSRAEAWRDTN